GQAYPSFIAGKPQRFGDEDELGSVVQTGLRHQSFADYFASGDQWRWWGVSSFVIQRDAFTRAGGFTEEFVNGEDADLALKLGVAPGFIQITSPATFAYREHELSAIKNLE